MGRGLKNPGAVEPDPGCPLIVSPPGKGEPSPALDCRVRILGLPGVTGVAAGINHSLAVDHIGRVWAWGFEFFGQVGDGPGGPATCPFLSASRPCAMSPVPVQGLADIVAVAGGWDHSLTIDHAGRGGPDVAQVDTPARVVRLGDAVAVAAGEGHSVALRCDGTILARGSNGMGQLGDGQGSGGTCGVPKEECSSTPVRVRSLSVVVVIASGAHVGPALVVVRCRGLGAAGLDRAARGGPAAGDVTGIGV